MQSTHLPPTPPHPNWQPASLVLPLLGWRLLLLIGWGLLAGVLLWVLAVDSNHERDLRAVIALGSLPLAGLLLWLDEANSVGGRARLLGDTLYLRAGIWPQVLRVSPVQVRAVYRKSYLELLRGRQVVSLLGGLAIFLYLLFAALYLLDLLNGTVDPLQTLGGYAFLLGLSLLLLLLGLRAHLALHGWRWHRSHLLLQLTGWPSLLRQARLDCATSAEIAAALGYAVAGEGLVERSKGRATSSPQPAALAIPYRALLLPLALAVVGGGLIAGRGLLPAVLDYRYQPMVETYRRVAGTDASLQVATCEVSSSFNLATPECDLYTFYQPVGGQTYTVASHYPRWPGKAVAASPQVIGKFKPTAWRIDERAALQQAEARGGLAYRQKLVAAGISEGRVVAAYTAATGWSILYRPDEDQLQRAVKAGRIRLSEAAGFSVQVDGNLWFALVYLVVGTLVYLLAISGCEPPREKKQRG